MDFMSLPLVMIENIFSHLSYDDIAKSRMVSKPFNEICSRLLNRGFCLIERRHSRALKHVKAQLPRRESERRYHQLSRHCDILTSIETRISMLNMTYSKFIDHNMCCFIPGKVIDEIRRVLILVETEPSPPRAHEVLQELRDISSMAIEHFDDKISPAFRKKLQEGAAQPHRPTNSVIAPFVMRQEMNLLKRRSQLHCKVSVHIANQYKKLLTGMLEHKRVVWTQQRVIKQMARRQKEQDAVIADLKKRMDECDIKYSELTHANAGRNTLTAGPGESSLRNFSSQIKLDLSVLPIGTSKKNSTTITNMKPRKPVIKLPSLSESEDEPPRKMAKIEPKKLPKANVNLQKVYEMTNSFKQMSDGVGDTLKGLKRYLFLEDSLPTECKKPRME